MKKIIGISIGIILFILLIAFMVGAFRHKIQPGIHEPTGIILSNEKYIESIVEPEKIMPEYSAIGTVTSQKLMLISSQVRGVVTQVYVTEGQSLAKNDLIADISDEELQLSLEQAKKEVNVAETGLQLAIQMHNSAQANYARTQYEFDSVRSVLNQAYEQVKSAQAILEQSQAQYNRVVEFKKSNAATQEQLEAVQSKYLQAQAGLNQAQSGVKSAEAQSSGIQQVLKSALSGVEQAKLGIDHAKIRIEQAQKRVKQAEIELGYTKIRAPDSAIVVQKKIEPGDLAWPGKAVVVLQKEDLLQLEARVPESLRHKITHGQILNVEVGSIQYSQKGEVSEIIPSADPMSRTFLIKVKIPLQKGLYSGMFGKVLIPLDPVETIIISKKALQRIGQFYNVYVQDKNKRWLRRFVLLGHEWLDRVEILSGLQAKDTIAIFKGE